MVDFDLVIIGAGPGGSITGRNAQLLGLNCIIIERGKQPGDKNVSGCALSPKLWRDFDFMEQINLPHRIAQSATIHYIGEDNIEKTSMSFSPSISKVASYKKSQEMLAMNVYRADFDQWLASLATKEGAVLKTSSLMIDLLRDDKNRVKGVILDDNTEITGKIIIGADGVVSTVAKASGLREKWRPDQLAWMVHYDFSTNREKIDSIIGNDALHYWYSATFPVGYSFFNLEGYHIGLGSILSMVNKNYDPHALLDKLLKVRGVQRQIELTNGIPREYQAHMFPLITNWEKIYADNVLLIGDAAGIACPLEAEGVYYAMLSGKIAAEVAKLAIDKGDLSENFLKRYDKELRESHIGEEFEFGPAISKFVTDLAFNYKAGKWVIPLLNDMIYGICNVSEAHITNSRLIEYRIQKYYPPLFKALINDFSPMVDAVLKTEKKNRSKIFENIGKKIGSKILPIIAKILGKKSNEYTEGTLEFLTKNFIIPYVEARRPLLLKRIHEISDEYNLKYLIK